MDGIREMTREQLCAEVQRLRARLNDMESARNEKNVALKALMGNETRYRLLVENQTEMIVRFDIEYRILYASPSCLRTFGLREEDVLGKSFFLFICPKNRESILASLKALEEPPHESRNETREETPSGWRWFEWHSKARVDESGAILDVISVGRDVTDRHHALEALRESEERYRDLMRNVPVGVFRTSLGVGGRYLAANPALAKLYGYDSVEELMARPVAEQYALPEDRERWAKEVLDGETLEGKEVLLRRRDGSTFWASVSARVIRDKNGVPRLFDGTLRDITAQKSYETAIARRDSTLEAITFAAERFLGGRAWRNEIDAVLARLGRATACSRAYIFEITSRTEEDVRASQRFEWTADGIAPQMGNPELQDTSLRESGFERWSHLMRKGETVRGTVSSFPRSEQEALSRQGIEALLAVPIFDEDTWWGFIGFDACGSSRVWSTLDEDTLRIAAKVIGAAITRTRTEERRRQLELIIEQSDEAVITINAHGLVEYVNPAFTRLMGYTAKEVLGKAPYFLGTGKGFERFPEDLWPALHKQRVWRGRMSHLRKDRATITTEGTVSIIRNEAGDAIHYVAVQRDVTDLDRLEAQLDHARKMESLGTLTGGIAHDFRNILSTIAGWLEMAMGEMKPQDPPLPYLDQAARSCGRASDLVKKLLAFSRKERRTHAPLSITPVIRESVQMLRMSRPGTVVIDEHIEEVAAFVSATVTDIEQIMLNLGSNAFHAMRDGGTLTVRLREVSYNTADHKGSLPLKPGNYVQLVVEDTGHGMSRELQQQIFDPFFTTKTRSEGTGLGLASVHGIVRSLGGVIEVISAPGEGSCFRIHFPVCDAPEAERANGVKARNGAFRGNESVMFVDDDASMAKMMEMGLGALGYTVETFTEPDRALASFRRAPDTYDVLVTDQVMPGMSGLDLIQAARAECPRLPVVLVSGYTDGFSGEWLKTHQINRLVTKPTGVQNVATAIRAVMGDTAKAQSAGPGKHAGNNT